MITNAEIKRAAALDTRRGRKKEGLFKAEGAKCVFETLGHFRPVALYATAEWLADHPEARLWGCAVEAGRGELARMSSLTTAPEVIALYAIPEPAPLPQASARLLLALDTIQDPGNLGTIIRVADWFGVTDILCSPETASCYSPKVVQATMGSIARVNLHYCPLAETIRSLGPVEVYGTFLGGEPLSGIRPVNEGIIVIGNEGNGISAEVERVVTRRITIPSFPPGRPTVESLNAAVATSITLAKFRGI